jgi:hypothetical protein
VLNSHLHTCENHISGSVKITSPEVLKSHTNNTNYNNTNPTTSEMVEDMFEQRNKYEKYFTDTVSYIIPKLLKILDFTGIMIKRFGKTFYKFQFQNENFE